MPRLTMLSDRDKELIQLAIDEAKRQLQNIRLRGHSEDSDQHDAAPEVYIAKTPDSGIPAAEQGMTGTGPEYLNVGYADCDIYTLVDDGDDTFSLERVEGLGKRVFNFTQTSITAEYVAIHRTKYGPWVANSSTKQCDTIRFNILTFVASTRTAFCGITAVPNGFTVDDVPDKVLGSTVYVTDPVGCYFSEPSGELVGREGWARYMKPESGHGGPGTAEGYEVPQWEVFALCCDPPACDT